MVSQTKAMKVTERALRTIAASKFHFGTTVGIDEENAMTEDRFQALFKLNSLQVEAVWSKLHNYSELYDYDPPVRKPEELLYTLYYWYKYPTWRDYAMLSGVSRNTLLHVVSTVTANLSAFAEEYIDWNERYERDNGSVCLTVVDGTDFRIREPRPFDRKWFSHKFNGPAVRYLVASCIQTAHIVYIDGPYPAGEWPDLRIARNGFCQAIAEGEEQEMALADGGFNDGYEFFETPTGVNDADQHMKAVVRARQEVTNRRFKEWKVLHDIYRGPPTGHEKLFKSIACITEMLIEIDEEMADIDPNYRRTYWPVEYYDIVDEHDGSDLEDTDDETVASLMSE